MRRRYRAVVFLLAFGFFWNVTGAVYATDSTLGAVQPSGVPQCPANVLNETSANRNAYNWHETANGHEHCSMLGHQIADGFTMVSQPSGGVGAVYWDPTVTGYAYTNQGACTRLYVNWTPVTNPQNYLSPRVVWSGAKADSTRITQFSGVDYITIQRPTSIAANASGWAMYRMVVDVRNGVGDPVKAFYGIGGGKSGDNYALEGLLARKYLMPQVTPNTQPNGSQVTTAEATNTTNYPDGWSSADQCSATPGAAGPATAPFTDYVRGLVALGNFGGQSWSWQWVLNFTGTYTIKRGTGAFISERGSGGSQVAGTTGNATESCGSSNCSPLMPWTFTINDTGRNKVATYTISAQQPNGSSSLLIGAAAEPRVTNVNPGTSWTPSTGILPSFSFRLDVPGGGTASCVVGLLDTNAGGVDGTPYIQTFGSVSNSYSFTNTNVGIGVSGVHVVSCSNEFGTSGATFTLNADGTTGGGSGTRDSEACGPIDAACAVRNSIRELRDAIGGIVSGVLTSLFVPAQASIDSFAALGTKLQARQPFSFWVGMTQGLAAQFTLGTTGLACWQWQLGSGLVASAPFEVCPGALATWGGYGVVRTILAGGLALYFAAYVRDTLKPHQMRLF